MITPRRQPGSSKHFSADYALKSGGRIVFGLNKETAKNEGHAITSVSWHATGEQKRGTTLEEYMEAVHTLNVLLANAWKVRLYHTFLVPVAADKTAELTYVYRQRKKPKLMPTVEKAPSDVAIHAPNGAKTNRRIIMP